MLLRLSNHDVSIGIRPCAPSSPLRSRENIHSEVYSLFIISLIRNTTEQHRLLNSIQMIPTIKAKAEWCIRWIEDDSRPFALRLIAFAAVEGIFFSSSFAAIFWLKTRGLMPGLCHSNELISRDEGMHTNFACLLYRNLATHVTEEDATVLITDAVHLEKQFFAGNYHTTQLVFHNLMYTLQTL